MIEHLKCLYNFVCSDKQLKHRTIRRTLSTFRQSFFLSLVCLFFFRGDFSRFAGTMRKIGLTSSRTLSSYLPAGERKKKKHREGRDLENFTTLKNRVFSATVSRSISEHFFFSNENPF